jgi:uncharacterized membrane protein
MPERGHHCVVDRLTVARLLLLLLILGNIALFGWLSVLRHESFGSSAMDLGYTDQMVWNTLRGRFLEFSTYQNAPIDLPLDQFRRTDTLLAYHVELLLVPISLLYLVWSSPLCLLLLQAVVVSVGAYPAFELARQHLDSLFAGLAFALLYLLAPGVEGALLSDFHAVSLTASLLLFAVYFAFRRRYAAYFVVLVLAMLAKEDVPVLTFGLGAYLLLVRRERKVGLITMAVSLAWFVLCMWVILPAFNGLGQSPFLHRLAVFGPTLKESVAAAVREPALVLRWLVQPDIVTYLGGLLASAGYLSLLNPQLLTVAAPLVAVNVFSTWSWTYSGGDHYSAAIMPFVFVSSILGVGSVASWLGKRFDLPYSRATVALCMAVLAIGLWQHHRFGVSPVARTFHPPQVTAHHKLGKELIQQIPPQAAVSSQANLYPHVSQREKAYLFPAVNDAEYILLDVTSSAYPITPRELYIAVQRLLREQEFGVLAAADGYLLLGRGRGTRYAGQLPDSFYTFARSGEHPTSVPVSARFGEVLELVGYDYAILNVVNQHQLPATVTTYWRALEPLKLDYEFALFFTRSDGAIVFHYDDPTSSDVWYPPHQWAVGEVVRVQTPVLDIGRLNDVLVAVISPGKGAWAAEDRVQVSSSGPDRKAVDGNTLLRLFSFQRS